MTQLSNLSARNLSYVFNQRNGRKRRAALRELWAVNGVFWSAEGTYIGIRAIELSAAKLLQRYPEYEFAQLGEIDEIPEAARMRWSFGTVGYPPAITGMDVVTASNGHIVAMYRFLDGAGL